VLIGEKVNLVAVERIYALLYTRWINDPEVARWLQADPPISLEMEYGWVDGIRRNDKMTFTILTKEGKPIGNTGLEEITWKYRRATIGIMIGEKDHWGKGYGSDAVTTLLRYSFEELGMRRVELFTDMENVRARKAYLKCGFQEEGVIRQNRSKNGRVVDDVLMSILSTEWFAKHPQLQSRA